MTAAHSMTPAPRALAIRQDKKTRIKRARVTRRFIIFAVTLVSLSASALLGLDYLFRPSVLIVDRLVIKGSFKHFDPATLQPKIEALLGRNFFTLDLATIKSVVDSQPWVERSEVRRQWPDTLSIEIVESVPVMRWKTAGWLTVDGRIVELAGFENLSAITVFGPKNQSLEIMSRAYEWAGKLDTVGLRLVLVNVSDWRSWRAVVSREDRAGEAKIEIALGTAELDQRFDRFLLVYQMGLLVSDGGTVFV
ncbi:MAG: FtsQ-type POTRA domain-containing protein, partial [Proteobacteria bacterium]|nr:FtsQ-type POTRA domain-containing protein [Pseudomonadota bacterium]